MTNATPDRELIQKRLNESASIKVAMAQDEAIIALLADIAHKVTEAFKQDRKVILCGNGGSAADSQHICAELVGKFYLTREPLPAVSVDVMRPSALVWAAVLGDTDQMVRQD